MCGKKSAEIVLFQHRFHLQQIAVYCADNQPFQIFYLAPRCC